MIKKLYALFLPLAMACSVQAQGFKYTIEIDGYTDSNLYLINYFGGKQYYNDTAQAVSPGKFVFEGDEAKPGGIYALLIEDKSKYMDLVIAEPEWSLKTKLVDLAGNAEFKGSPENDAFLGYVKAMGPLQQKATAAQNKLKSAEDKDKEAAQKELDNAVQGIKDFKDDFYITNDGLFCAKVFKTSDDPEIPEAPEGTEDPEMWKYQWFRKHYFDNIDLKDQRLLRSPVLHSKIDYYLQKLTPQVPDTICQAAYDLANASGEGTEIYRYVIQYTVNTYDKKKVMGMDAVFVCLASKVYCQDKAFWLEEDRVEEICDRYSVMKNLTIGQKAENIVLPDEKGYWTSLYDVKAKYTVLIFWASDCGHCKKEMPKLLEAYHENKDKGLKVFAVSTQFENEDWVKFIKKDSLDWINVSDNPEINENAWWYIQNGFTTLNSLNFRDYWDIFSTPQVYILDENKEIIGKKIGAEQITDFLSKYDEEFETAKPELYPNNNGKSDVNYKEALPKIGEAPQGTE